MKFSDDINKYMGGEWFGDSVAVAIADKGSKLDDTTSFLKRIAAGRRVIHIGAVDHLEGLDRKIEKGNWLHKHLSDSAQRCVGIDINREGIDYLKERYNIEDLYCADITADTLSFLGDEKWDVVMLPDVLEHVPDVFSFLKAIHDKLAGRCETFVITVPNAFCLRNIKNAMFKGVEKINTDHRYWFTPYTLAKLLTGAGFVDIEVHYVIRNPLRNPNAVGNIFKRKFLEWNSCLRDTIILNCKF